MALPLWIQLTVPARSLWAADASLIKHQPQLGSSPIMICPQLDKPSLDPNLGLGVGIDDLTIQWAEFGIGVLLQLLQLRLRRPDIASSFALNSLTRASLHLPFSPARNSRSRQRRLDVTALWLTVPVAIIIQQERQRYVRKS